VACFQLPPPPPPPPPQDDDEDDDHGPHNQSPALFQSDSAFLFKDSAFPRPPAFLDTDARQWNSLGVQKPQATPISGSENSGNERLADEVDDDAEDRDQSACVQSSNREFEDREKDVESFDIAQFAADCSLYAASNVFSNENGGWALSDTLRVPAPGAATATTPESVHSQMSESDPLFNQNGAASAMTRMSDTLSQTTAWASVSRLSVESSSVAATSPAPFADSAENLPLASRSGGRSGRDHGVIPMLLTSPPRSTAQCASEPSSSLSGQPMAKSSLSPSILASSSASAPQRDSDKLDFDVGSDEQNLVDEDIPSPASPQPSVGDKDVGDLRDSPAFSHSSIPGDAMSGLTAFSSNFPSVGGPLHSTADGNARPGYKFQHGLEERGTFLDSIVVSTALGVDADLLHTSPQSAQAILERNGSASSSLGVVDSTIIELHPPGIIFHDLGLQFPSFD
jgi:hypothetical protein